MRTRIRLHHSLLRALVGAGFLVLLGGCASVKETMRDAHRVLFAVAGLTEHGEGREMEQLYLAEDRIYDSCSTLLSSINTRLLGDSIPLFTKLEALFSSDSCQRTVDDVRGELDAMAGGSSETR